MALYVKSAVELKLSSIVCTGGFDREFQILKKTLITPPVVPMRKRTEVISAISQQYNQSVKWKAL